MRKITLTLTLLALTATGAFAQNWNVDKAHSNIGFAVDHMVITETEGDFENYEIKATSSKEDFSDATFEFTAEVNSINTGDEKRDGHLKSPDFFDAANHPNITFKSKSFKKDKGNMYKLTGDLTMRGTTKEVTLDVKYTGTIKDPWGNTRAGFKIKGEVNRMDYGLNWNAALETGGLVVSEEVRINCNVELIKAQ